MYVILFKSPSLGLLYITMYIEIIAFGAEPGGLCSMGAVFGCPRPRPPLRYHPSPCPLRLPSPRPLRRPSRRPLRLHHPPCLAVVGLNSWAWGSFVMGFVCPPGVLLSGGRVVHCRLAVVNPISPLSTLALSSNRFLRVFGAVVVVGLSRRREGRVCVEVGVGMIGPTSYIGVW